MKRIFKIIFTSIIVVFASTILIEVFSSHSPVVAKSKEHLVQIIQNSDIGIDADLSHIDVSNVTDMSGLFRGSSFNGDISNWNVSSVTNMSGMFKDSGFNGDISNWDVSSVTNMSNMFNNHYFKGDISNWNVSSVTNMSEMFESSKFNGDLSNWNVSSVTNMSGMFKGSRFNSDISNWNVSSVTNMSSMFYSAKFNGNLCNWLPSKTINTGNMFSNSPLEKYEISVKYIGSGTLCITDFGDADNEIYTLSNQSLQNKEWKKRYVKLISDYWWYYKYKKKSMVSDGMDYEQLESFDNLRGSLINVRNNETSKERACAREIPQFEVLRNITPFFINVRLQEFMKKISQNYKKLTDICKQR